MATLAEERLAFVHLKINRAEQHIADLDSAIRAFHKSIPYEIGTKRNPQTRKLIYYVSRVQSTPPAMAAIAGDAIQNLRSSLDHLAYQLFLVGGGRGNAHEIFFLIEHTAKRYVSFFPGKVQGMRQDAQDALRALEPYKRGKGHDLWRLHTLNNVDKHRLLITVGSSYRSLDVGAVMMDLMRKSGVQVPHIPVFLRPANNLCPLKAGDELYIGAPDEEPNQEMTFRFDVALKEPGVADGEPLLETVQHFAKLVRNIVDGFLPCLA